jgi:hypothetical protein
MAQEPDEGDATPPTTLLTGPLVWTSEGCILVNGREVAIKGINWFGFGTSMRAWEGERGGLVSPLALGEGYGNSLLKISVLPSPAASFPF